MFLFIRCTATDPTDKTSLRKKKPKARKGYPKLNYGFVLGQIIVRFFRRMERKILRTFIRRRYLDPWKTGAQLDPLLPFPFVLMKEDAVSPDLREDDISFCALCDFEVRLRAYLTLTSAHEHTLISYFYNIILFSGEKTQQTLQDLQPLC